MRVLAAMSGGVDSAVAAAKAVDAGHDVVGVHLALSRAPGALRTGSRGCCTIEDSRDAYRACDVLGIPYYVWDFSERFQEDVVDDFIAEYSVGRTPNPCMRCNERIKFAALLDKALNLGFEAVATGHYASVVTDGDGNKELHRAADSTKDQSYVLGVLTSEQLEHCMFPLGSTASKAEVRAEARRRGLSVASKPDSHDICFIPDGDTRSWLAGHIDMQPGAIVDENGERIGEHNGAHAFTVGQRRGLRIGRPAADGKPRFVLEIQPRNNTVVVGPEHSLQIENIRGIKGSWVGLPPREVVRWRQANAAALRRFNGLRPGMGVSEDTAAAIASGAVMTNLEDQGLERVSPAWECEVQLRAHGGSHAAKAFMELNDQGRENVLISLTKPVRGVAPGQTAVMYQGSRVLGQATIGKTYAAGLRWREPAEKR